MNATACQNIKESKHIWLFFFGAGLLVSLITILVPPGSGILSEITSWIIKFAAIAFVLGIMIWRFPKKLFGRIVLYFFGVLFPYITFSLFAIIGRDIPENMKQITFDQAIWKDATFSKTDNPIRIRMADDLMKRYRLKGMTKKDIKDLLGNPDETEYFKEYDFVVP